MKIFLQRWAVTTLAVAVAAHVVPGIDYKHWLALVVASLLLGILNAVLRPILMILSLPLLIVTLGLFTLVINALLLYFVGFLVESFHVASFGSAILGGLVISIVTMVLNFFLSDSEEPKQKPPNDRSKPPSGKGPIIDV